MGHVYRHLFVRLPDSFHGYTDLRGGAHIPPVPSLQDPCCGELGALENTRTKS